APSTEPIARPAPVVTAEAAPAPVVQPAPVAPAAQPAPPAPVRRPATIVVQNNQTLADIAKQWGNSVPAIMMENNLVTDQVKPGTKLKLPPAGRK
ncbi:MAG: LysM peptidoglycan-binding domain-containing protein, partial [Candidatus Eisenbacteria bacterium]|nr:LysM peptidoglycan-binding domain-containing protein [Candidatus Eisenbacteria bacterium]